MAAKTGRPPRPLADLKAEGSKGYERRERKARRKATREKAAARTGCATESPDVIERYCRTGILGYDPWEYHEGYEFDPDRAYAAVKWCHDHLKHVEGALGGKALQLEIWQQAIVGNLWGWLNDRGLRRYKETFIFVPQKSGKTTFAAGLALLMLDFDDEPGAKIYSVAYSRDQAALVWNCACGMVGNDADLLGRFTLHTHKIWPQADVNAFYRTIAAKEQTAHGANVSGLIVDEEHTFDQKREDVIETLQAKTAARAQPLVIKITTAGWNRDSICYADYDRSKQVRDHPELNPRHLPVIYEAPADADWTDEKVWAACNPNWGVSVFCDEFREACRDAQANPRKINRFKQLRLNMWTAQAEGWITPDIWARNGGPVSEEDYAGGPCWAGLDLSQTRDLSAFVVVWRLGNNAFVCRCWFWLPLGENQNIHERGQSDKINYDPWVKSGILEIMPARATDYSIIRKRILEVRDEYDLQEIAFDSYKAGELVSKLEEDGFDLVEFSQSFANFSAPSHELERLLAEGRMRHLDNPVLRWNAANAVVEHQRSNPELIKPVKGKSVGRIDGIIALIQALDRTLAAEQSTPARSEPIFIC